MVETAHWFGQRGYEVIWFDIADISTGQLDDDLLNNPNEMVVRGGVGTIRQVLQRAGRPAPPNIDLPASLSKWIGRRFWQSTMGKIRSIVNSPEFQPVHIKPLNWHKLFKGTVVRAFRDLIPSASVSSEEPVLVQELVEFVSEWRAFILRDNVLNVGNYRGNPLKFPDPDIVASAVSAFEDRPISFGMDWGITTTGQTLLVEVNDGFSLGNYGLRGPEYTALIEARWRQLMGLPDNGVGIVP
eukprot:TRINITY_DN18_c4_g1_i9.p3 TRINITY_DN18_c4_g1~~TRINITY_DN18_c4_g1_i9.p3  ORF type:complete len:242 (+),score=38.21 TRINITY_DN18_c4_g1_i9:2287-3012(+)